MSKVTILPNGTDRLPKWAQEHIRNLERERDVCIRELNKVMDSQTESGIYYENLICTGEQCGPSAKRFYVQSDKVTIEHGRMRLDIYCRDGDIDLSWGPSDNFGEIAFIPKAHQRARLVAKERMRG